MVLNEGIEVTVAPPGRWEWARWAPWVCNPVTLCSDQLIVVVGWDGADERVVVTVAPPGRWEWAR